MIGYENYVLDVLSSVGVTREAIIEWGTTATASSAAVPPQFQALTWLLEDDSFARLELFQSLPHEDNGMIGNADDFIAERYVAAVLYFATGGPTSWYDQLGFLNSTVSVCAWNDDQSFLGITCDDIGYVTDIYLGKSTTSP